RDGQEGVLRQAQGDRRRVARPDGAPLPSDDARRGFRSARGRRQGGDRRDGGAMTAFEKRLARSSARYREAPRIRLIRRLGPPGAAASWMGANAVQRASSGPSTQLHEGGPDPSPARTEDPGRRAVSLWLRLLGAHNLILREVRRGVGGAATLPQFDVLAQ